MGWKATQKLIHHWKILRGDNVMVTRGKDRGEIGMIKRVIRSQNRVIVEGKNLETIDLSDSFLLEKRRVVQTPLLITSSPEVQEVTAFEIPKGDNEADVEGFDGAKENGDAQRWGPKANECDEIMRSGVCTSRPSTGGKNLLSLLLPNRLRAL
ncbi:hypothetical protein Syun_007561 [Stephania yunnanensis]|uniref:KOW domain-containing protein n=1 Tax=Stephania yunnanensis TaxID=152371 RepID=A0AAP0L1A4_9MAGN